MARSRRPSPQTVAVLDALAAQASDWSHGYDLCRTLDLKAGTVYPILIRLAERGLVETAWETDVPQGRPARHLYRLTSTGAQFAADVRAGQARADAATTNRTSAPRLAFGTAEA